MWTDTRLGLQYCWIIQQKEIYTNNYPHIFNYHKIRCNTAFKLMCKDKLMIFLSQKIMVILIAF